MTKKIQSFIVNWAPAIIWMVVIFILSSRRSFRVDDNDVFNFLFFKSVHVGEYALLTALLFRGYYLSIKKNIDPARMYTFFTALLYAMSDELHQTFILTREGRPRDVFIDLIGITLMLYLITLSTKAIKKFL